MKKYAYIRVSSIDQCVDRQVLAVKKEGIQESNVFIDRISGYTFNRPQYQYLKKKLKKGDLLVLVSLDRLGRNYKEILNEWRYITETIGADIFVMDMPALDTRKSRGLIENLITDIVLQLLSYVAETEREFLHERQSAGIAAAKQRGVKFGRPKKALPQTYDVVKEKWNKREISSREAAAILDISHTTFLRWSKIF